MDALKDVHAAEFDIVGKENEERRAVCESSEGLPTVALWVPCAKKLYSAVRKKYIAESMTKRLGAVLDCYVACRQPDERMFEFLK